MYIKALTNTDLEWNQLIKYAKLCSWGAGPFLAKNMEDNKFL